MLISHRVSRLPLLLLLALVSAGCTPHSSLLDEGDLLFHVVAQGNHITEVTPGQIDHVAIYAGKNMVVEAIPGQGVVTTPLHELLSREDGHYLKGRVKGADRQRSLENACQYLGLPYDSLYLPTADAIYCSELVQLSFVDKHGQRLLVPVPMSFHDSTGHITAYWQQFYARHGMDVPEGQPGTNPAELSKRQIVKILGELR